MLSHRARWRKLSIVTGLVVGLLAALLVTFESRSHEPCPAHVPVHDPETLGEVIRTAMLTSKSVEVRSHAALSPTEQVSDARDLPVVASRRYDVRHPTAQEKAKALRVVQRLLNNANAPFALDGKSEVDQEIHIAQKLKDRDLLTAVTKTLADDRCFLTKGIIPELKTNAAWHYWNVEIPMREGDRRWTETLYVPLDLSKFPDIGPRKERLLAIREFKRADDAYAWNSRPYAERSAMLATAERARQECAEIERQLESMPSTSDRSALLQRRQELMAAMSRVPSNWDPSTLEDRGRPIPR